MCNWYPYWISQLLGGMSGKKLSIPVWTLSTFHVAHEILEYLELTFQRGLGKDTMRISYNEILGENKSMMTPNISINSEKNCYFSCAKWKLREVQPLYLQSSSKCLNQSNWGFTAWHSSLTETVELLQSEPSDWIKYLGSAERNIFLCEAQPEEIGLCNLHSARDSLLVLQSPSMVPVTKRSVCLSLACWVWLLGLSLQNGANNSPHAHLRILHARHNSSVNVMLHNSYFPKVHSTGRWGLPCWSAAECELAALCLKKPQQNPNFSSATT